MAARLALLIGNGQFPDEPQLTPLRGPPNDVQRLAAVLGHPDLGGFSSVETLVDRKHYELTRRISRVLSGARPGDLVLLYYSGHGKLTPLKGDLCLCTADTTLDELHATSLLLPWLRHVIDESPCDQITLVLDCCFSGAATEAFTRSHLPDQLANAARQTSGFHILSSSTALETSVERLHEEGGEATGSFTRCLIEGIESGKADLNDDGEITGPELIQYAQERLRAQRPQYSGLRTRGFPPLAWNRLRLERERARLEKERQLSEERQRLEQERRLAEAQKEKAERHRKQLGQWKRTGELPSHIYWETVRLLRNDPQTTRERELRQLILDLPDGNAVTPGDFVSAWEDLSEAHSSAARTSHEPRKPLKTSDMPITGKHAGLSPVSKTSPGIPHSLPTRVPKQPTVKAIVSRPEKVRLNRIWASRLTRDL